MCLIKRSIAQKTTRKGPRMMEEHASIPPSAPWQSASSISYRGKCAGSLLPVDINAQAERGLSGEPGGIGENQGGIRGTGLRKNGRRKPPGAHLWHRQKHAIALNCRIRNLPHKRQHAGLRYPISAPRRRRTMPHLPRPVQTSLFVTGY